MTTEYNLPELIRTSPERIHLCIGDDPELIDDDFNKLEEITWSHDQPQDITIGYIREDVAQREKQAAIEADRAAQAKEQPVSDPMKTERAEFEAWANGILALAYECEKGRYVDGYSEACFQCWQAAWDRRAAPAQPTDAELEMRKGLQQILDWRVPDGSLCDGIKNIASALLAKYGGAAQPSGWQPIETALKYELYRDGSHAFSPHILGWYPGAMAPMRMRWWRADSGESNFLADGGFAIHPTHWMPLPPPPPKEQL